MLNLCIFQGRLVRDPEFRTTTSGEHCATFTIAVERDYKPKDGGDRDTDYVNVVTWRHTADFAGKYFTKGKLCIVEGRMQSRKWVDKDGNKRIQWECIADDLYFGESKKAESPAAEYQAPDIFDHNDGDTFTDLGGDDGELPF